jgi:2-polyprenyl-6-methoxyphenol hydroxylase-like FAD-dependent oxidoreductase
MHRADLQEILLKAIPSEMLRLGDACKKVDAGSLETGSPSADSATIRFAEGQSIDADLVIGADGIESTVRQSLLDIDPRRETGTVTYRGVVEQQSPLTGQTLQVWGQGTRVGIAPLGDGRSYWFATSNTHLAAPEHPVRLLSRLQDRYQDYPSPIPELIKGTTPDALIITELADIGPLPRWHAGRTVLLGDAAHAPLPYLGQGAGQALEDAVALTRRLTGQRSNGSESAGSTQEGSARPCLETDSSPLESYERARKSRAEWITRLSRLWWRLAQLDGSLARTRNLLVRYGPESIAKLQQNRVARARF